MTDETREVLEVVKDMFGLLNNKMDERFNLLSDNIEDMKKDITRINMTLENDVKKDIRILAEGYTPLAEKVDKLAEDMETVKFDVDVIKKSVASHTDDIKILKQVK